VPHSFFLFSVALQGYGGELTGDGDGFGNLNHFTLPGWFFNQSRVPQNRQVARCRFFMLDSSHP